MRICLHLLYFLRDHILNRHTKSFSLGNKFEKGTNTDTLSDWKCEILHLFSTKINDFHLFYSFSKVAEITNRFDFYQFHSCPLHRCLLKCFFENAGDYIFMISSVSGKILFCCCCCFRPISSSSFSHCIV